MKHQSRKQTTFSTTQMQAESTVPCRMIFRGLFSALLSLLLTNKLQPSLFVAGEICLICHCPNFLRDLFRRQRPLVTHLSEKERKTGKAFRIYFINVAKAGPFGL